MNNSNPKDESRRSAFEYILGWEEVGLKVYELRAVLYQDAEKYHALRECPETKQPQSDSGSFQMWIPEQVVTPLKRLFEMQEEGFLCHKCMTRLEFEYDSSTQGHFKFHDIESLAAWLRPLLSFKLKKKSLKGVGKVMHKYHETHEAIQALSAPYNLPGSVEIQGVLNANLDAFKQEVKEFRESPEGIKALFDQVTREVFEAQSAYSFLPSKSKDGENAEGLLKEVKKFKKSLRKQAQKLSQASLYSLCNDSRGILGSIVDEDEDNRHLDEVLIRSGLNFMIAENWLSTQRDIISLPYPVMLYIKKERKGLIFECINLDSKPSERLIECMKALYLDDGSGISFLQAYKAAVAID